MAKRAYEKKRTTAKAKAPPVNANIDHGTLVDWVNEADDGTQESRAFSEKCRDYYDSKQLTDTEVASLTLRGQAPVVINRVKPKIDGLLGMEKQQRTTAKALARTPKHEKGALAATEATRFVLQDNFYHQHRSNAWDNILVEGTGAIEVIAEPRGDDYRITINPMYWNRLIYDPHSRRKDFGDARYLGQVVWMDYDEAIERYPDGKDVLESLVAGSTTYEDIPRWLDSVRRRVKIVELYYHQKGDVWYACFTRGGYCEEPKVSPYVNEEGETEWPYEFASAFVDREGQRYGAVKQLLDVQDEINKRRSKALHLMSVRQIRLERGAVEDVNKVRQELAKPDGVVETTPGMEFEVLKTGDMATAQFNLLTEAKQEIDAVGFNAAVSGKDERAMSGRALFQRAQAGQTELAPLFDALKHLDQRVYRKVWNRIKQYWRAEKWVRVTDDEMSPRFVGLNVQVTKGQIALKMAGEQGLPPEAIAQMQQQIAANPMMKEVVQTDNDLAELDVDIVMTDAPDAVTTQVEDFQVLGEMVKSGFPMPPLAVIEASPLSNKEKILKMMKEGAPPSPQHQAQMQQMQEQGQAMAGELKKLQQENAALKLKREEKAAELDNDTKEMRAKLFLQKEKQDGELNLAREKAFAELQLEKDVAEERRKMADAENTRANEKLQFEKNLKVQEKGIEADTDVMPVIMGKIEAAFSSMVDVLSRLEHIGQQQLALQSQTLAAIERPKQVSLSALQRDAAGRIVGGTVTPSIMH